MRTLTVPIPGREYDILIHHGLLQSAGGYIRSQLPRSQKAALVTDTNVAPLYASTVADSLTQAAPVRTAAATGPSRPTMPAAMRS